MILLLDLPNVPNLKENKTYDYIFTPHSVKNSNFNPLKINAPTK